MRDGGSTFVDSPFNRLALAALEGEYYDNGSSPDRHSQRSTAEVLMPEGARSSGVLSVPSVYHVRRKPVTYPANVRLSWETGTADEARLLS